MLVETAIGDGYGVGFEYADENLQFNTLERYVQHPTHLLLKPGMYSDDTQMSIAIAEAIVEGLPWTKEALAQKFVDVFRRDQRDGYSRKFQKFLEEVKSGPEFLAKMDPSSDKSGGAMRAGPCGIFKDIKEVEFRAGMQASITHNTPDGIAAAQAAALMTHYFLYDRGLHTDVGSFVKRWMRDTSFRSAPDWRDWDAPWTGKVKAQGWMSVRAAITAIQAHDSLSEILKAAVAFSGDVDTVGAIAMSAASCAKDIKQDLPDVLRYGLEHSKYGLQFLTDLDAKLMALKGTL